MGLWSGIGEAEIFERGNYMSSGFEGQVQIKRTLVKHTRKVGDAFIVNFTIITTNQPEQHSVGSMGSWFQKLIDKNVAFSACKQFVAACAGIAAHEKERLKQELDPIIEEALDAATENETDNAFINSIVFLRCVQTTTRDGNSFTRYDWFPSTREAA